MSYIGFESLKNELGRRKGVTDAGGLAAYIGRKKYGANRFQHAAAAHKSLKGAHPRKKQILDHLKRGK